MRRVPKVGQSRGWPGNVRSDSRRVLRLAGRCHE